jgi:eukaryotic-like serine/threonine-protein kinase
LADEPSLLGTTLDRKYKLVLLLGEGGMGSVYQAEREGTSEPVAIKVIHGRLLGRKSDDGVRRFRREARAAGALDGEHIVKVLDSGTDEATGLLYLVMEFLQGEDVQHLIERVGPIEPDAALRIAAQALLGLQKAHEASIVHRDIKPANIFLARQKDGEITVKILDFGIAKIKVDQLSLPHTTGLTTSGGFLGSPLYMSPEQMQSSRDVDHRTDLWSLGCALYCLLAGCAPYQQHAESVAHLIYSIMGAPPPLLRNVAPWVSLEVAEVVHGALGRTPEERYPSAAAMLDALRPLLPNGFALREKMLVAVSEEERALALSQHSSLPTLTLRRVGVDTTDSIIRDASPANPHVTAGTGTGSVGQAPGSTGDASLMTTLDAAGALDPTLPVVGEASEQPVSRAPTPDEVIAKPASETPLEPIADGPKTPGPAGGSAIPLPAPQMRSPTRVLAGAILAAAIGAVVVVTQFRSGPVSTPAPLANTTTSAALAEPPPATSSSAVSSASSDPSAATPLRHGKLAVFPKDASVEVNGVPVTVQDGFVEITGPLGSAHRVHVFKPGMKEIPEVEVRVTEEGTSPVKVELSPLAKAKPGSPRPAAGGATPPRASTASTAPEAPPPKPTSSDDDIVR